MRVLFFFGEGERFRTGREIFGRVLYTCHVWSRYGRVVADRSCTVQYMFYMDGYKHVELSDSRGGFCVCYGYVRGHALRGVLVCMTLIDDVICAVDGFHCLERGKVGE